MKRSNEISEIVAESRRILKKGRKPRKDSPTKRELALTSLLQKAVAMLYTHQDCVDHLKLGLDDDFVNLPTEVVHDVIELASFEDEEVVTDLKKLSLINGSWAEFGNDFASADGRLRDTIVDSKTDLNELKMTSLQLCGHIELIRVPNHFYESLGLMGTRFSSIEWKADENLSEVSVLQMTRFLKRQLKSQYLRKLFIEAEVETEVSELFVDFVKRPHFEVLWLGSENPFESRISFEVFEAAHNSWESEVPQNSPLSNKWICGSISHETAKKLKKHFNATGEFVCLKHPVHSEAGAYLRVREIDDTENYFDVSMTLDSLAERSGCVERGYVSDCVDSNSSSDDDDEDDDDSKLDSECDSD